ncbi:energy-coupling factor ABC transporter ATP-binding protein [Desulforhopalus sp. 52FAK]
MKLYKLENIKRIHGTRTTLRIDDLAIVPGKIYTLIGPNGAGKTTLLKLLSFLDLPSSGTIHFLGEQVGRTEKQLQAIRRRVVLLDQSPIMFTGSVWKNIEYGLKVRGVEGEEKKRRIWEALALVGMERFKDYNARGLSGGETKRIALARALVLQPEVLLCDEPTANVDGENQQIILETIAKINKEQNTSVIFSTHYLSQGQRLADHSLLLQHGALSDMANENIFRITVAGFEEDRALCQLTGQLMLRVPRKTLPQDSSLLKIHIKSGLLTYGQESKPGGANVVAGHVTEIVQESGTVRLGVNVGVNLVVKVPMAIYLRSKPALGEKLEISIPDEAFGVSSYSST